MGSLRLEIALPKVTIEGQVELVGLAAGDMEACQSGHQHTHVGQWGD